MVYDNVPAHERCMTRICAYVHDGNQMMQQSTKMVILFRLFNNEGILMKWLPRSIDLLGQWLRWITILQHSDKNWWSAGTEVQKICICEYVNMKTRAIYKIVVSALLYDNQTAKCIRLLQVVTGRGVLLTRWHRGCMLRWEFATMQTCAFLWSNINSKDDDGNEEDTQ